MVPRIQFSALWTVVTALVYALPVQAQIWRPAGGGILNGISGMALVEQDSTSAAFLIVHDNKNEDEQRVARLTLRGAEQPMLTPLTWPSNSLPVDLEALTAIPNQPGQFLALSSTGRVYHIQLADSSQAITVLNVFDLPPAPENSNFEGLALQQVNGTDILAWADRGKSQQPATLYWAGFELDTYTVSTPVSAAPLTMPWPLTDVRHISDLKIDPSGAVFITSAADPGNDGPFSSAFYLAGILQAVGGTPEFRPSPPVPLLRFNYHKIEALELMPGATGGVIFGTDDENFGGSVYPTC
jgi:hypothetical protein